MRNNFNKIFIISLSVLALHSCVSQKEFREAVALNDQFQTSLTEIQKNLNECINSRRNLLESHVTINRENENLRKKIVNINNQIETLTSQNKYLIENNDVVLKQIQNLSILSNQQALNNKSLENLGANDDNIRNPHKSIAIKDSIMMKLASNLKIAIGNLKDNDINIKIEKNVIYIDISDKLLFKADSYLINEEAKFVLEKLVKVLKSREDIEFIIEGHVDNSSYNIKGVQIDNWDFSVKKATSVVRTLENDFGLDPKRMTAAGRGEHLPIGDNTTKEGRTKNRRTRIIILSELG